MAAPSPEEIYDAYLVNADYDTTYSAAKCRLFIAACRQMIGLSSRSMRGGQGIKTESEWNVAEIRKELVAAQNWLALNDDLSDVGFAGGTIDVDFTEFDGRR